MRVFSVGLVTATLLFAWSDANARITPKSRFIGFRQVTLNPDQAQTYSNGGVGPRQVTLNPDQAQTYPNGGVGPRQVTLNPDQAQNYSSGVGPRMEVAPQFENRAAVNCGSYYIAPGSSKTFQSKNYPSNYPGGKKCTWKFRTSVDSKLSIQCNDFNMQQSRQCRKDFFRVTDSSGFKQKYCGAKGSLSVSDKSRRVTVLFKTNRKKSDTGFSCSVRASVPDSQTTVDPQPTSECTGCGQVNRANRIVGGVETEVNEYPWMVSLVNGNGYYHFCGGSIISSQWVVTAAHCAAVMSTSDYVLVGDHNLYSSSDANSQWMQIAEIVSHPSYDSNTLDNDIALIRLTTEIQFPSDNKIAPVCLPTAGEMYDNVDATITGWGAQQEGGSTSGTLFEVTVPTMTNTECNNKYGGSITDNMICAGIPEGGKDSCQGDSGGPMVVEENGKWKLVGVVSWGNGCARPDRPGVYARVTQYLQWISDSTTGVCVDGNAPAPTNAPTPDPTSDSDCPGCGQVNRANRIVGGVETEVNEYPWMVSLVNGNGYYHFCGGSIISSQWVVTAAHCAVVMSTSDYVLVGDHNLYSSTDANSQWKQIAEIVSHPSYDSNTLDNDIALIRLTTEIQFPSDNKIAPVCLPTAGEMYDNVDAIITGWGAQQEGGSTSGTLFEVTVPTMTNNECNSKYGGSITANMICAGISEGGKDSCQGDSGGPMVVEENGKWKLVGVVSWGYGCARPDRPGVYARVTR
ncbi:transmembrane protease serine 9-like [Penaeus indicus]|uniref:transmembrane protease serine 9-like n=1 Tax=Penaeus indicus TaxID=29960 RepID=UPI00300C5619